MIRTMISLLEKLFWADSISRVSDQTVLTLHSKINMVIEKCPPGVNVLIDHEEAINLSLRHCVVPSLLMSVWRSITQH